MALKELYLVLKRTDSRGNQVNYVFKRSDLTRNDDLWNPSLSVQTSRGITITINPGEKPRPLQWELQSEFVQHAALIIGAHLIAACAAESGGSNQPFPANIKYKDTIHG